MKQRKLQWGWIVTGVVLLAVLLLVSIDPHLVTSQNPNQTHYANYKTGQSAPFPPSSKHPFGTDQWGRDLLARTLAGTFNTLLPAAYITLIVLFVSLLMGTISSAGEGRAISKVIHFIGGTMASVPVLFVLILVMNQRNMQSPYQELQFVLWIAAFEIGRASYAFQRSIDGWFQMGFVEAALMIGRSRIGTLFTHLRTWLVQFTMEFVFSEFARVLSIMTMLATFHVYAVEHLSSIPFFISYPPIKGIESAQLSWVSMIGDSTNNAAYISYPYFLYAPVLALLMAVMGANLIAKGIRGRVEAS